MSNPCQRPACLMDRLLVGIAAFGMLLSWTTTAPADDLREAALKSLRRATQFYLDKVSTEGGYLYHYSEDLSKREGEHEATAWMVWVQPPGTPAVGLVFLEAYRATGDEYYMTAAKKA